MAGAVAFLGVFAFLAARFDYPAILDGTAEQVLPELRAIGGTCSATPQTWSPRSRPSTIACCLCGCSPSVLGSCAPVD